jgi:Sulfotransferase domain
MTLPNFLVIGAQRAGTTLLHRILAAHPQVFVPFRRKEVHYFDRYADRGVEWYAGFFPPDDEAGRYAAIGEATPDYLFEPSVPRLIHELLPSCRLMVSLRNPVNRAYSAYLYSVRSRNEKRSFVDVIAQDDEILRRGFYSKQLERYLQFYAPDAMLVLIYEELIADPRGQLDRVAKFLRLESRWEDPDALMQDRINASEIPRFRAAFGLARRFGTLLMRNGVNWPVRLAKRSGIPKLFGRRAAVPPLTPEQRRMLQDLYSNEITALERMLGRELPSWRAHGGEVSRVEYASSEVKAR